MPPLFFFAFTEGHKISCLIYWIILSHHLNWLWFKIILSCRTLSTLLKSLKICCNSWCFIYLIIFSLGRFKILFCLRILINLLTKLRSLFNNAKYIRIRFLFQFPLTLILYHDSKRLLKLLEIPNIWQCRIFTGSFVFKLGHTLIGINEVFTF